MTIVVVVLGAAYGVLMVRSGFSTREPPSAAEAVIARTARRLAVPQAMRSLQNPLTANETVLATARAHWGDHCAICHAADGSGNSEMGKNTYPPAPDMRADAVQSQTDGELYAAIQNGVRLTAMPSWGTARDDDPDTWALVAFIRTLPTLTPAALKEIQDAQPRSMHEMEEEMREQEFLRGD